MKWGTRVTALAAATVLSGIGLAGAAEAGPPVYSRYTVNGTTHVAKPNADVPLGPGKFDMYTQIGSYTFYGTITLPPVKITRTVPGAGTVSGTLTLGPGDARGSVLGSFSGSATWPVQLSDVRVNGAPYDVGTACGTAEPVTTELVPDGFVEGTGGRLNSTYSIGAFANCGSATALLNTAVPGPGNTLALDLTWG
jgi:hypothetical protein